MVVCDGAANQQRNRGQQTSHELSLSIRFFVRIATPHNLNGPLVMRFMTTNGDKNNVNYIN